MFPKVDGNKNKHKALTTLWRLPYNNVIKAIFILNCCPKVYHHIVNITLISHVKPQ